MKLAPNRDLTVSESAGLEVSVRVRLRDFLLEIELNLESGKRLALVGPSGAGKTSILRTVAGLIRPESGLIKVAGKAVFDSEGRIDVPPEDRRCGYVPQDYSLFPHMSVIDNVGYGMRGLRQKERRQRSAELLDQLGIKGLSDVSPSKLSGGEKQRVALARALATEPEVFLLDEPLSALDKDTRKQAIPVLEEALDAARVPALIVTHSRQEAERLADTTVMIERGKVSDSRDHGVEPAWSRKSGSMSIHRAVRKQRD